MDQQQFGGSLGGPLVRNRTFYFANVERKLLDQTGVVTILSENVPIINARLSQVGYQGQPVETGIYPNPVHSTNVLGKIEHQLSGADQLSLRYALYDVTSSNARGVGALNAPSVRQDWTTSISRLPLETSGPSRRTLSTKRGSSWPVATSRPFRPIRSARR